MVADIITEKRNEIAALCREYRILALWLFGSGATDVWNSETSDLDFLADLGEYSHDYASRFLGMIHGLEELLGRPVDMLTVNSLGNPCFREEVEETRVLVYESRDAKAGV